MIIKICMKGFRIIKGKEYHIIRLVYRSNYRGIIGNSYSQRSSAVKGFAERNDLFSSGMEGSKLHCIFICLCARVTEEQLVFLFTRQFSQFVSQFLLQGDAD